MGHPPSWLRGHQGAAPDTAVMSLGNGCDSPDLAAFQQPQPLCPHVLSRAPVGAHEGHAGSIRTFGLLYQLWHGREQQVWALCKGSLFQSSSLLCPAARCCGARQHLSQDRGCDESARDIGSSEDSQQVPLSSLTASCRYPAQRWWCPGDSAGTRGLYQLFPQGPLIACQSPPQVSRPTRLEHWGGVEEIGASLPAYSPLSLPAAHLQGGAEAGAHPSPAPHLSAQGTAAVFRPATRALGRHLPLLFHSLLGLPWLFYP